MKRILIILILGLFCFGCFKDKLSNDLAFDSGVWKEANKRTRGRMSLNLVESRILIGKNKNEVEDLLGNIDFQNENGLDYLIDIGEWYDYYFSIHFDEKTHKVISTDIGD